MLEGFTELLEHGLDVTLLDGGLTLDEVCQLFGANEMVVIDGLGKILAEGLTVTVFVLRFNKFLSHS